MTRARLLGMDEPSSGLDPLMTATFQDCLREVKARGQTVPLSSHVLSEVEAVCDRMAVLRAGVLVEEGTLAELRHLHANTVEATYVGVPPELEGVPGVENPHAPRGRAAREAPAVRWCAYARGAVGVQSVPEAPPAGSASASAGAEAYRWHAQGRPPRGSWLLEGGRMQGLGDLTGAVSWFVLLAPPLTLVVLGVARSRHRDRPRAERRRLAALDVLVALSALGAAAVTLFPVDPYHPGVASGVQLRPLASVVDVLRDSVDASVAVRIVGLNVLLFVPLGLALTLRTRRWTAAVVLAAAMSLAVEALQALLPLGRTANVDDVILNTSGAGLGVAAALLVLRLRGSPPRPAVLDGRDAARAA